MLSQKLQQKMLQKLSPQQIQLMKLLQVPTMAIEQRIKEELEQNPALDEDEAQAESDSSEEDEYSDAYEEISEAEKDIDYSDYYDDDDIPDYKLYTNNQGKDNDEKAVPISGGISFHELLLEQLSVQSLTDHQKLIAEQIIGNIDDSGYLRRELDAMLDDLAFTQNIMSSKEELEELLEVIQEFEPAGVGARDLRECLLIQLERKQSNDALQFAFDIVYDHFDAFTKKHYSKIIKKTDCSEDDLKNAIDEILKLNPKPGNSLKQSSKSVDAVVPDFHLNVNNDDEIEITINGRNAPDLRINRQYKDMMEAYSQSKGKATKAQKDALVFVKKKIDSAKWFIDAIKQRQNTLASTMKAIAEYQHDYFVTGDETKLKPMILKDISEIIHLDISTVSRVVNSKYVSTPFGTFLLKSFFSESLTTDSGEEVSTREVKKILQDVIEAESKSKPLTDDKLAAILNEKGYNIARRTIAKYREQLNIPVARLRKEI